MFELNFQCLRVSMSGVVSISRLSMSEYCFFQCLRVSMPESVCHVFSRL